jgi:hypothetical protein
VTAFACGLAIGAGVGAIVTMLVAKLRRIDSAEVEEVSEEDRDHIEANFAAHLEHMRGQVSDFADALAGDDPLLRERLRMFEGGDRP